MSGGGAKVDRVSRGVEPQRIQVNLLPALSVSFGDHKIHLKNRKSGALLAYMALSDVREETRDRVVGLLWSETEEEKARASLRQALYEIRTALEAAGCDAFSATKVAVAIDRDRLDVDVQTILSSAGHGRIHPVLLEGQALIENLLSEFENVDPAFRVWLVAKRQTIQNRLVGHLEHALRAESADTSHDAAQALLNLDSTHEEAVRVLMRSRSRAGDIGGALSIYKRLWDELAEEFDVEPSKETQDLVARLKLAQPESTDLAPPIVPAGLPVVAATREHAAPTSAQPPLRLVVGVASFDAASVGADRAYLIHGFRRELIANLVRFREWSVRDGDLTSYGSPATAHEYIVEASAFQSAHDVVRLVVTLRDTKTQEFVWSDQCNLAMNEWVEALQQLVKRIAGTLNVYLSVGRIAATSQRADPHLRAYDRWLYGQSKLHAWDPAAFHEATKIFEEIIAESPNFSPAYSTLAQLQNTVHFVHPGVFREVRRTEQALNYAREAARIDPIDSRAQLSLGWAHAMARQHDLAEAHHELAVELNENDPWTITSAALGYATRGQLDQARVAAERASARTPSFGPQHWGYHLQIRFMTGDYAGSVKAAALAGDVIPTSAAWKIASLGHLGRIKEAKAEVTRYVEQVRSKWFGSAPPSEENIARWTLHCFPFKRAEDWRHFRDGLAAAGLPVANLKHDAW
jgi:DNA-binding SARP family transcriptional activator/tetratricopeptide (TPR) repeat protein